MRPVVWLHAARLLSTMSRRRRGETPNTVAFRIETGAKSGPASSTSPSSERTFDSAYAVSGFSGASSSTATSVSDAPYIEQDEANTNRRTPASRAARASREGRVAVDLGRQRRVEVAHRIVRERREVDDRVEALQFGGHDLADVARERLDLSDLRRRSRSRGRRTCRGRPRRAPPRRAGERRPNRCSRGCR